jgi:ATP-dependent Clp protease ATP-binding subunit ClpA
MTMITFEYSKGHEVVGRNAEIDTLRKDLADIKIRVVCLDGGLGVGKTALANRLLEMTSAGALAGRFDKQVSQSAYQEAWDRVLSQLAEKLIGSSTVLKATRNRGSNTYLL